MIYGENEGAKAWLVGEENRGLAAMFVMMNAARLAVGTQGVAIGERAYQQALAFARERRQGRGPSGGDGDGADHRPRRRPAHADDDEGHVQAARGICHLTAASLDLAAMAAPRKRARQARDRAALLTPIAKAFSTDIGDEAASLGVQVHGGMGFIEETGAAQHMRDSRIAAIYEGTNGVQAIDLVQRKLPLAGGETVGERDRRHPRCRRRRRREGRRGVRRTRPSRSPKPPTRSNRRRATCSAGSRATRIGARRRLAHICGCSA